MAVASDREGRWSKEWLAALRAISSFCLPHLFGPQSSIELEVKQSFRQESDLHGGDQNGTDLPKILSGFRVYAAKAETVSKVMDMVKQQLALGEDAVRTPESKFAEFGADSLDTVEEFKITVEAADLIDKLVDEKPAA
ncbi:uncharacterized protein LOC133886399 [Phragmites australis]|uniref:uncharacterized protein LOC133886399 n=1 Tax=Phragmites australis TaxID=29695 RepID=UPI002D76CC56|nr:uncharacterized protein LOC133886399 [Phragmites australis]